MSIRTWMGTIVALVVAAPASAVPLVLDFEEFAYGEKVFSSQGVTITTENFAQSFDFAVAFDSENGALTPGGDPTTDPDLLRGAGWAAGNLAASNEVLGNLLIVQENNDCTATLCSDPDDQAGAGGRITLDYSDLGSFDSFSFDLVDYQPDAGESGSIQFLLGGQLVGAAISFDSFLGVTYGDNSANRIDFGSIAEFDEVVITLGGSAGIDNLVASPVPVPEPNSLALGGLGLVMLASIRRRRNGA